MSISSYWFIISDPIKKDKYEKKQDFKKEFFEKKKEDSIQRPSSRPGPWRLASDASSYECCEILATLARRLRSLYACGLGDLSSHHMRRIRRRKDSLFCGIVERDYHDISQYLWPIVCGFFQLVYIWLSIIRHCHQYHDKEPELSFSFSFSFSDVISNTIMED